MLWHNAGLSVKKINRLEFNMSESSQKRWNAKNKISVLLQNPAVNGDQTAASYIVENSSFHEVKLGEEIITQGAQDKHVIFLLSGDVNIVVNGQISTFRSAPWTVGEMSAVNPKHPRSASVLVKTERAVYLKMSQESFLKLCSDNADFRERLDQNIQDRFQERLNIPIKTNEDEKYTESKTGWVWSCLILAIGIFIAALGIFFIPNAKLQLGIIIALFFAVTIGMFAYWRHERFFFKNLIRLWVGVGAGILALSFRFIVSNTDAESSLFMNFDNINPTVTGFVWVIALSLLLLADHFHTKKYI